MISNAAPPHSASTNGAMLRPVPCSALSEPSYFVTTISTRSTVNASYCRMAASSLKDCEITKWRLPSLACPKMMPSSYR